MSESALAVIESRTDVSPAQMWRATTERAALVKQAVLSCTVNIQGKRYLNVAGYQAIANAFGCVAAARDVEYVNGIGWKCVGEVRRISDGVVLSTGVGFVGDDEKMWASRPVFARVAMCQTRACGRALRAAFAFMAPLIDAGLETTPAEEMELVTASQPSMAAADKTATLKAILSAPRTVDAPKASPPRTVQSAPAGLVFPNYGRAKGQSVAGASEKDLAFYRAGCIKTLEDPAKSKWHDRERQLLAAIDAELEKLHGPAQEPESDGPPPHTDADAPF